MIKIEDVMSLGAVTVHPDMPLIEAVDLMNETKHQSLPVTNSDNKLVGLLREKDLILNDSFVHLQTLYKLLGSFDYYKKDNTPIQDDLRKILDLTVEAVMSPPPPPIRPGFSVEQTLAIFSRIDASDAPIVDEDNRVVGTVSLSDLTKIYGVSFKRAQKTAEVDRNIDNFLQHFEKQFVVVTKTRTKFWLLVSLSCGLIGFIIATILLIRIST